MLIQTSVTVSGHTKVTSVNRALSEAEGGRAEQPGTFSGGRLPTGRVDPPAPNRFPSHEALLGRPADQRGGHLSPIAGFVIK